MGLYRGIGGLLVVEVTGADMEKTFDAIMSEGIALFSVRKINELCSEFTVKRSELVRVREVIGRRGDALTVCGKKGIYWKLTKLVHRPVLILGGLLMLFLTAYLPGRVMFIEVEGNHIVPDRKIIEAVRESGIGFWTRRDRIRSEQIKNSILSLIPQIEWAGVNTNGCLARISVRERDGEVQVPPDGPCSIFASREGVIHSITASKGSPRCAVGDAVTEGQLLISGSDENGSVLISGRAEGEVYAYTSRALTVVMPRKRLAETGTDRRICRMSLVIGKKRINFWKGSGICPATCDRMYREYELSLPGGLSLPVHVILETILYHDLTEVASEEALTILPEYANAYLLDHMVAGSILSQELTELGDDALWRLDGHFGCLEMIGRKKRDEIGEIIWQDR